MRNLGVTILLAALALAAVHAQQSVSGISATDQCTFSFRNWTKVADMPHAHVDAASAIVNGKLFVIGGAESANFTVGKDVDVYDPKLNKWTTRKQAPVPIGVAAVAADSRFIFIAGGVTSFGNGTANLTNAVWAYDTKNDAWISLPALPNPNAAGALVLVDFTEEDLLTTTATNTSSGSSANISVLPIRQLHLFSGLVSVSNDTSAYLVLDLTSLNDTVLGSVGNSSLNTTASWKVANTSMFLVSNSSSNSSSSGSSNSTSNSTVLLFPSPRDHFSGPFIRGNVYLVGGQQKNNSLNATDLATNVALDTGKGFPVVLNPNSTVTPLETLGTNQSFVSNSGGGGSSGNISAPLFVQFANMPQARSQAEGATFGFNGRFVMILGGKNNVNVSANATSSTNSNSSNGQGPDFIVINNSNLTSSNVSSNASIPSGAITVEGITLGPEKILGDGLAYDTEADTWVKIGNLPKPLVSPVAGVFKSIRIGSVTGNFVILTAGATNWTSPNKNTYITVLDQSCTSLNNTVPSSGVSSGTISSGTISSGTISESISSGSLPTATV